MGMTGSITRTETMKENLGSSSPDKKWCKEEKEAQSERNPVR